MRNESQEVLVGAFTVIWGNVASWCSVPADLASKQYRNDPLFLHFCMLGYYNYA
jgi:hypothetical protein